uniref:Putative thump domain-containing protein 1 n=1 Tax=Culex tarsalis TaxID=7177 RepID=A0A1Q3EX62_CULTA
MDASKQQQHSKGKTDKRNYYAKAADYHRKKPAYLEPGQRGFLVTCNMRERDCTRDAFRLLNEYADELYGKVGESPPKEEEQPAGEGGEEEEEKDISVQVQKQAEAAKTEKKKYRFESVDTGAKNVCFIKTVLEDPTELALKILRDAAETKKQKSRNILRLMPIEVVTKANLKDIMDGAGKLFDRYFLKEPKTFAIIFNRRFNNGIERESVIDALAEMISSKNRGNKANLKNPELAVIVEVIKGLVLISVVPEFPQLRKYNLMEICTRKDEDAKSQDSVKSAEAEGEKCKESNGEKVVEEDEAKNGEEEDAAKGEEGSQEESKAAALSKDVEKAEEAAASKEEAKAEQ